MPARDRPRGTPEAYTEPEVCDGWDGTVPYGLGPQEVRQIDDAGELAELLKTDPETHLYGLGDVEEPFWSHSTWYQEGPAVVGLVSAGEAWMTAYAMSRAAPEATLRLLAALQDSIPSGTWATGPTGMYEAMSGVRATRDAGPHWRMILENLAEVNGAADAVPLSMDDLAAVADLHASDEGSTFFMPGLLASNPFVGIWEDGRLVASAGTHVTSRKYGVAAIGAVITRPSHRGRGLGSFATSALCQLLAEDYETVGLNVEASNEPALRVYDRLGFRRIFRYEEVEFV